VLQHNNSNSNPSASQYELKITTNNKGTITAQSGQYEAGTVITGQALPDAGYTLKSISSSEGTVERDGTAFRLVMPSAKTVLTFVFEKDAGSAGGKSPSQPNDWYAGSGGGNDPGSFMDFLLELYGEAYAPTAHGLMVCDYSYDPEGNLLAHYKEGNGTGEVKEDYAYAYDKLNRLTEAHGLYGKTDRYYTYDSLVLMPPRGGRK
jgi:hypothetical protein